MGIKNLSKVYTTVVEALSDEDIGILCKARVSKMPTTAVVDFSCFSHAQTRGLSMRREPTTLDDVMPGDDHYTAIADGIIAAITGASLGCTRIVVVFDGKPTKDKVRKQMIDPDTLATAGVTVKTVEELDTLYKLSSQCVISSDFSEATVAIMARMDWSTARESVLKFAKNRTSRSQVRHWQDSFPPTWPPSAEKELATTLAQSLSPNTGRIRELFEERCPDNWVIHQAPGEADWAIAEISMEDPMNTRIISNDMDHLMISLSEMVWSTSKGTKRFSGWNFWVRAVFMISAAIRRDPEAFTWVRKYIRGCKLMKKPDILATAVYSVVIFCLYGASDYHPGVPGKGPAATVEGLMGGGAPDKEAIQESLCRPVRKLWNRFFLAIHEYLKENMVILDDIEEYQETRKKIVKLVVALGKKNRAVRRNRVILVDRVAVHYHSRGDAELSLEDVINEVCSEYLDDVTQ